MRLALPQTSSGPPLLVHMFVHADPADKSTARAPHRSDSKDKLAPKCRAEVFRQQLAAARDFRADPELRQFCEADAQKLCAGVAPGGGRVQACLVRGREGGRGG